MTRVELVSGHPGDDRLLEAYVDRATGATDGTREHVEDCAACRERYLRLTGTLDVWRAAAEAEADAVFTESRLERQRHRILSRIAALSRSARVLRFPVMRARTFGPSEVVVMKRWVAAAAAAGLLVGLGLGRLSLLAPRQPVTTTAAHVVSEPRLAAAGGARVPAELMPSPADHTDDEQLLLEIEDSVARDRSRIRELQVIDELTPRVRTAVARLH